MYLSFFGENKPNYDCDEKNDIISTISSSFAPFHNSGSAPG